MEYIKLIVLDIDGTLTDNSIFYDNRGFEIKKFNVKDGMGIGLAIKAGIEICFLTGRESNATKKRGMELGVKYIYQNISNKIEILQNLLLELDIERENVCYIGDDINDINAMLYCGFSACPKDSSPDVLKISNYISKSDGGNGAVREIIEYILKSQLNWDEFLKKHYMRHLKQ